MGIGRSDAAALYITVPLVAFLQLADEAKGPQATRFWCPVPTCSALIIVPDSKSTAEHAAAVKCSACSAVLCMMCRSLDHDGMSCAEAKVSTHAL